MSGARQPEGRIVTKVLAYLNALPDGHARKVHGNAFTVGEPDVDACVRGRSVKVEIKVPGGRATPLQAAVLDKWRAAGALAFVAHSVDEVRDGLRGVGLIE